MPSTRDLSTLPGVSELRFLSQSLALLDAILCPEWEYRYHSFDTKWAIGEEMASKRDGSGNGYFILFTEAGAILKGFARESEVWRSRSEQGHSAPGLFDRVPNEFAGFLTEPAFSIDETTFCLWRRQSDVVWQIGSLGSAGGEDPDGSAELLLLLGRDPEAYRAWAEDYFETSIEHWPIDQIMAYHPLTDETVKALNPDLSLTDLAEDLSEIAYPTFFKE